MRNFVKRRPRLTLLLVTLAITGGCVTPQNGGGVAPGDECPSVGATHLGPGGTVLHCEIRGVQHDKEWS